MDAANTELSLAEARAYMMLLLDGEISPEQAEQLQRYLELHPEAQDWLESATLSQDAITPSSLDESEREESIGSIFDAINDSPEAKAKAKLIQFPRLIAPLAAAAAVAIVATVTWLGWQGNSMPLPADANVVEFVATDIPDASTFIYSDEETGWTVVWVESDLRVGDQG